MVEYTENENNVNDMPFCEYLDMWLEQIKPLVKPTTWEGYCKAVNGKIKPYFKNKKYKLKDLKGMYFTEYFVYLKENGRTEDKGGLRKKSVLNIRGVLSSAFTFAVENGLMRDHVINYSRFPIFVEEPFTPTIYTAEQIKTLLTKEEETNDKACLFLYLEMFTGARRGELAALIWENVDFENNTIHICLDRAGCKKVILDTLTTPKTQNGIRTIPLPSKVMDMLKTEKEKQEQNKKLLADRYKQYPYDYVIRQADGSSYSPNTLNKMVNRLTDKLGLPHCRLHDYRHAVASILFENGTPLADVTTHLGHGQTSTTEKLYIHKIMLLKLRT